jgi:hypothetical protein
MSIRDELKSRLFLRVALPLTKVVREDDPRMRRLTRNMKAVVQFAVKGTDTGAHLIFADDNLEVVQGLHEKPTVSFNFKDQKSLNDFFAGKLALPSIQGLWRLDVILRTVPLLLMKFPSIEGAYQVLTSKVALVEAVKQGHVVTEGAMEYSKEIGIRMQMIEELMAT